MAVDQQSGRFHYSVRFALGVGGIAGTFFDCDLRGLPHGGAIALSVTDGIEALNVSIDFSKPEGSVGFLSDCELVSLSTASATPGACVSANNLMLAGLAPRWPSPPLIQPPRASSM